MDPEVYYVSVRNPDTGQFSLLAGPYETHQEALDKVRLAKELALQRDPFAQFYAYGTASLPAADLPDLPASIFNTELETY